MTFNFKLTLILVLDKLNLIGGSKFQSFSSDVPNDRCACKISIFSNCKLDAQLC